MRQKINLILFSVLILALGSCEKKGADNANVTFEFENYVDAAKVEQSNTTDYVNAAGNKYNVNLLRYYISNIVLVDTRGNEVALKNHDLIDAFDVNTTDAINVPNGDYVKMRFLFGVDAANNTSGDQSGDLDPSKGMLWSWNTGYIFLKHEGKYKDASDHEQNLEYHLGKQEVATEIELNLGGLIVDGEDKKATLRFNLNNMYNDPVIDFNTGGMRHSSPTQTVWMADMKANLVDAFSYIGSSSANE